MVKRSRQVQKQQKPWGDLVFGILLLVLAVKLLIFGYLGKRAGIEVAFEGSAKSGPMGPTQSIVVGFVLLIADLYLMRSVFIKWPTSPDEK